MKLSELKKNNNEIRIAVIDSGVGGLSVFAEVESTLSKSIIFPKNELMYVNVVPDPDIGYNKLDSTKRKIDVFNDALYGIKNRFNPQLILIACNTLSVIFNQTKFAENEKVMVLGIVETGVELFYECLKDNSFSIMILGTETTIKSSSHKKSLIGKGIDESRIITQSCPGLESSISLGPESNETKNLIRKYISEALKNITDIPNLMYIGLCCTHYGYAINSFYEILSELKLEERIILNPNKKMAEIFLADGEVVQKSNNCRVISKVEIEESVINNLYPLLGKVSVKAAESLRRYEVMKNLFDFVK